MIDSTLFFSYLKKDIFDLYDYNNLLFQKFYLQFFIFFLVNLIKLVLLQTYRVSKLLFASKFEERETQ